jgi:hypothetical protein
VSRHRRRKAPKGLGLAEILGILAFLVLIALTVGLIMHAVHPTNG